MLCKRMSMCALLGMVLMAAGAVPADAGLKSGLKKVGNGVKKSAKKVGSAVKDAGLVDAAKGVGKFGRTVTGLPLRANGKALQIGGKIIEKGGKAIGGNGLIGKATEAVGKGAGMLGKGLDKAGKAVQEFPPKPRATIGPPAAPSRQTALSPNVRDHRTVPAQRLLTPVPSPRRVTVPQRSPQLQPRSGAERRRPADFSRANGGLLPQTRTGVRVERRMPQ